MSDKWISVKKRLPKCNDTFKESDYLLTFDENTHALAVAWYNKKLKQWTISHFDAPSTSINVTHWMELPKLPNQ